MPDTMTTERKEKKLEARLGDLFQEIAGALSEESFSDTIEQWQDVTYRQEQMIKIVKMMTLERGDGIPLKELAEKMNLTPGTVSESVEALVRKDALERNPNPADRRSVLIRLSPKSTAIIKRGLERQSAITASCISEMTKEEQSELLRLLEIFYDRINKRKAQS